MTFFNDGQQINGNTDGLKEIKLFDESTVIRLTNEMCCIHNIQDLKYIFVCNLTEYMCNEITINQINFTQLTICIVFIVVNQ